MQGLCLDGLLALRSRVFLQHAHLALELCLRGVHAVEAPMEAGLKVVEHALRGFHAVGPVLIRGI